MSTDKDIEEDANELSEPKRQEGEEDLEERWLAGWRENVAAEKMQAAARGL